MTRAWWERLTPRKSSPATCAISACPTRSSWTTSGSRSSTRRRTGANCASQGNAFYRRFLRRQFEMNDHRAVIVGVCEATPTFQSNPVVYTTYSRAKIFAPQERKILSYVLAKTEPGRRARERRRAGSRPRPAWGPMSSDEFMWMTIDYYLRYTGIPFNFGITALLGFLVGTAIAGQTFYNFTIENIKQFGALKAMGMTNVQIVGMILLQATVVGLLGLRDRRRPGGRVRLASDRGRSWPSSRPGGCCRSPRAPIVLICILSSLLSVQRVDPARAGDRLPLRMRDAQTRSLILLGSWQGIDVMLTAYGDAIR